VTGDVTVDGPTSWIYDGTSQYVDSDGSTWTSTIKVSAANLDDDAFTGIMTGTIESDTDGHLYTADWAVVANRQ